MNSVFTIHPYRDGGVWMFDDPAVGLEKEPFVQGADVIIDRLAENIPYASLGFTLRLAAGGLRRQLVLLPRAGAGGVAVPGAVPVLHGGAAKNLRAVQGAGSSVVGETKVPLS